MLDIVLSIVLWAIGLTAVFCVIFVLRAAWQEGVWERSLLCLIFPPYFLFYIVTRWKKLKYFVLTYVVCAVIVFILQRVKLGRWDWPDAELWW